MSATFNPHRLAACLCAINLLAATALLAQTGSTARAQNPLEQMSGSVERLTRKVSPAVVKILVTGYGPIEEDGRKETGLVGRQHAIGSGAIIDPKGYIVTNAHVVERAERVRVVLTSAPGDGTAARPSAKVRTLDAKIAGVDKETDLAVLKIEAAGLPTLPIGDYRKLRQGQLVFAFGSPGGLDDSVTMGVVSSVMRQPDPDSAMIYIQTDAAINPGNSGGPLVDVDGNLMGINTFILSQSGGSEGLGFAIPSVVVRFVYQEILAHGHVHSRHIGVNLQAITPALAKGLGLPRDSGLVISDVLPGGPADQAGVKIQDVVLNLDGTPVERVPMFKAALYRSQHGDPVSLDLLRGSQKLTLKVAVVEEQQNESDDLADLVNPEKSLVPQLGILGVEINAKISGLLSELRMNSGVLVAARAAGATVETGLRAGDVIHSLNGTAIATLDQLRAALRVLKPGDSVALQLERDEELMYIAFDLD
jgi:serine protease Do